MSSAFKAKVVHQSTVSQLVSAFPAFYYSDSGDTFFEDEPWSSRKSTADDETGSQKYTGRLL